MKKIIFLFTLIAATGCGGSQDEKKESEEKKETTEQKASAVGYAKGDLKKIGWIEGKWKGLYKGQPFYEIYRLSNDSTLEITSYEWNGKDSSKTSLSYVQYKDGVYYLGEKRNYKVVSITDNEIKMIPNVQANNDILWKYRDSTGWDAILASPKETLVYNMQRFDPFKK
jgi:hypothetical protein